MEDRKVLIVGAGPSGMVLALSLLKAGVRPRIIDKASGPGQQSRAMGVHARTLEFYRQLGFANEVVENGIQIEALKMWVKGEFVAKADIKNFGENISPYPFILSYPQDEHEVLLVKQLEEAGLEIERNTELVSFQQVADEVNVVTRKIGDAEQSATYTYLCGCDGAKSVVRDGLKLEFSGGTYDKTYFVADVEASGVNAEPSTFNFCIRDKGFVLIIPVRTSKSFRIIGVVPDEVGERQATFDDVKPDIDASASVEIHSVNWFSTYRVHHRVTDHFRVGHVYLSGDAGHIHSPVGAQGMNTGIGDVVNLAWKLAAVIQGRANASILDTYEPERIAFAHALLSTTDKIFELMGGSGIGEKLFRESIFPHLFPYALGFANIRTAAFKAVSQTKINYRDSALGEGVAGNVHGGDRLPWVVIDETTDNFIPLQALNWQVHVYGRAEAALKQFTDEKNLSLYEFDWTNNTQEAGLLRDAMYLVRPDGYVGLTDAKQNVDRLREYMEKFNIVTGQDTSAHPVEVPRSTGHNNMLPQEVPLEIPVEHPSSSAQDTEAQKDLITDPVYDELAAGKNPVGTF